MREAIWGRHGRIVPAWLSKILWGLACVLTVWLPFVVWVLMGVYHW